MRHKALFLAVAIMLVILLMARGVQAWIGSGYGSTSLGWSGSGQEGMNRYGGLYTTDGGYDANGTFSGAYHSAMGF